MSRAIEDSRSIEEVLQESLSSNWAITKQHRRVELRHLFSSKTIQLVNGQTHELLLLLSKSRSDSRFQKQLAVASNSSRSSRYAGLSNEDVRNKTRGVVDRLMKTTLQRASPLLDQRWEHEVSHRSAAGADKHHSLTSNNNTSIRSRAARVRLRKRGLKPKVLSLPPLVCARVLERRLSASWCTSGQRASSSQR